MNAKILMIDDEPQIRRVLKTALTSSGYVVEAAATVFEGLRMLRDNRFDLLLLDMNLPDMSGIDACSEIRRTSEIPIIILTVRDYEKDKVAALDRGADDYITKPFSMPELLARIRANLRRTTITPQPGDSKLSFGNVQIDLNSRHVYVGGRDVRFTPKEFDLLHYFVTHPNTTIPHGRLLQAVWGPDYGNEIEYLHVFVNQIRKKVEPEPSHPQHVVTELRVGYRFVP